MKFKEINPGMIIHCPKKKNAKKLFKHLKKLGYKWKGGEKHTHDVHYRYGEKTCYELKENMTMRYADIEVFSENWFEITEFSDVILNDHNTGDCNTGNYNTGDCNTGNCNTGDRNTGNCNTGGSNIGDRNTGYCNIGDCNTGDYNTGDYNTGSCNIGNYNIGNCNTGICNTGNCNTGDYNTSDFNSGCFCTEEHKILFFDKKSAITYRDWVESPARKIMNKVNFRPTEWIPENSMTEEEKEKHVTYKTTRGYLKIRELTDCYEEWWSELSNDERQIIMEIPNFNPYKFQKITGIRVKEGIQQLN